MVENILLGTIFEKNRFENTFLENISEEQNDWKYFAENYH